jgi:membrane associated rhomboid family serine protease
MIPLRDTIPARRFPVVNTGLIVLNVLLFLLQMAMGPRGLERFITLFGLVPRELWQGGSVLAWLPLLSSMFLHGGWWHLISNMLALYIFGDNVEDRLGHGRYLFFYLLGGIVAGLAHVVAYADSTIPTVGASGAIAAVLGAYLILFPRSQVVTLVFVFYIMRIVRIPALIYLGFWFISQLFNGVFALTSADVFQGGGVAWWAHIGGFLFGLAIVRLIARPVRPRYEEPGEYPLYRR